MKEKDFNLLTEPWIRVLNQEGQMELLSITEVFKKAHLLLALAGEMVAQDVSILRVLLAVLYAVIDRHYQMDPDSQPQTAKQARAYWTRLWQQGQFDVEWLEAYLNDPEVYERFFLFHPVHPFMQSAILPDSMVDEKGDGKLLPVNPLVKPMRGFVGDLSESANKAHLFSYRKEANALEYPEAARWLIHFNSYDVSPLGAPPRGFFRAKGFKLPWPNNLGLVWASGDNLFETLMLNLVLASDHQGPWQQFVPVWEAEPLKAQQLVNTQAVFPDDPCALFTFPFRHLQLNRNEDNLVHECVVWGGQLLDGESGNTFTETMTLWRLDKEGRHIPKSHDPARQMWRDLGALLSGSQVSPPGVVSWLSSLQGDGSLSLPLVRLSIGGVVLSSKKTSVDDAFSDSLRFHTALLNNLQEGWSPRISRELSVTDKLVQQAGYLAADLMRAAGGSGDKDPKAAANKTKAEAYFLLDSPFRQWLEGILPDESMDEACLRWRNTQQALLQKLGQQLVNRAGLKALTGRVIKGKERDTIVAAPALYQRFIRQINKILTE